ncbi:hypothetical protein Bca4012_087983 [Brassica carinata]
MLPLKYTTGNRIMLWRRLRRHSDSVSARSPQVDLVFSDYLSRELSVTSLISLVFSVIDLKKKKTLGRYNGHADSASA